jgi:hypothetical protein
MGTEKGQAKVCLFQIVFPLENKWQCLKDIIRCISYYSGAKALDYISNIHKT